MITIPADYFNELLNAIEDTIMIEGPFKPLSDAHGDHLYDIKKIRHIVDQIETFIANMTDEKQKVEIRRILDRGDELAKAFQPFGAQMDFLANTEKPITHLDYLAKLNIGFEAFVYYLEDLRADFGLDIPEPTEGPQSPKQKKSEYFPDYLIHADPEGLAAALKNEFKDKKASQLRLVVEALRFEKVLDSPKDTVLFRSMANYFGWDIGTYESVFSMYKPKLEPDIISGHSVPSRTFKKGFQPILSRVQKILADL